MTNAYDDMESMALSDEVLESIVGGLSDRERQIAEEFATNAKRNGLTLDEAIKRALHPRLGKSYFTDEMIQHLTEFWNCNYS